jgi:hypothetical protein
VPEKKTLNSRKLKPQYLRDVQIDIPVHTHTHKKKKTQVQIINSQH